MQRRVHGSAVAVPTPLHSVLEVRRVGVAGVRASARAERTRDDGQRLPSDALVHCGDVAAEDLGGSQ